MRKFLHAADIHLDSPLQKLGQYEGAPVEHIRGASRRSLENLVRLAIDQAVDLVVIAGDLYDGDWTDQNTGLFFVHQATKLVSAGIPVVVIRGNHDAANRMTSTLPLPRNPDGSEIMMRADQVDLRLFDSIGVAVHGRSFLNRAELTNLAEGYPSPISGYFNIGLLHTSLTGAEGHDPYSPCTPAQLADKRYDYWALGHVHVRGNHAVEGAAPVIFSGNLQGRHIRESGPKGCVLVEIDSRNACSTRFCELDVVRWHLCPLDISSCTSLEDVNDEFREWLATQLPELSDHLTVLRVELRGTTALYQQLHQNQLKLRSSFQALAVTYGRDRVWLEDVRIRCAAPSLATDAIDLSGPLASLAHVLAELERQPDLNQLFESELQALRRRLPPEVNGEELVLPFECRTWVNELLHSAGADVQARLHQQESDA
jgi:DNA repair exonuclease SbcCD nuclease subunit